MKTTCLLILSFFLTASLAFGQEELFKVLASKGANQVQRGSTQEVKDITIGKKLFTGDKITVGANGYLGLADNTGKTIELKKAGTYEVDKLSAEVANQNVSSLTRKYINYMSSVVSKPGSDEMSRDRYRYMNVMGAVDRGPLELSVYIPKDIKNLDVLGSVIMLKWDREPGAKSYKVEVMNLFEEPISTKEIADTIILLNLDNTKNNDYIVKVSCTGTEGKKSREIRMRYAGDDRSGELKLQLAELKQQLGTETALTNMVLASFYEDNKLYLEAIQAYEKAIKIEPEVDDYKVAYGQFLERAGIIKKDR